VASLWPMTGWSIPINWKGDPSVMRMTDQRTNLTIGRWAAAPSYADVVAAYPAKPKAAKVDGHVVLNCAIASADG